MKFFPLDVTLQTISSHTGDYEITPAPDSDIQKQIIQEDLEDYASDGAVSSNTVGTKRSAPSPDATNAKKPCEHPDASMG